MMHYTRRPELQLTQVPNQQRSDAPRSHSRGRLGEAALDRYRRARQPRQPRRRPGRDP
jgi:hypothetical protein